MNYYLTGKTPIVKITEVPGYSTDVVEQFNKMANKGQGIVTPSLTTRMIGVNNHGTNFAVFKPYFTHIESNGKALFKNMTDEMVEKWNKEIAPKYGISIDPISRTAEQLTLIKTK